MDVDRQKELIRSVDRNEKISTMAKHLVTRMILCNHEKSSYDLHYQECKKCGAMIERYCHASPPRWFEPISGTQIE